MKEILEKIKDKIKIKYILGAIGGIGGIFLLAIINTKIPCYAGLPYNYTDLKGETGSAEICSYEEGIATCRTKSTVVVVSEFHKNKWCD